MLDIQGLIVIGIGIRVKDAVIDVKDPVIGLRTKRLG